MKTVGILGGMGPESTIEYYRLIITSYREKTQDDSYPSILINSINARKQLDMTAAGKLTEVTAYLLDEIKKMAHGGADFGVIAANTPHIVFDELELQSPIPLVSIVEATCETTRQMKLNNVGLFGTRFTMQGKFFPAVFSRYGISIQVPETEDQNTIHSKYMNELVNGIVLPETQRELLKIASRLQKQKNIQALIVGGTELSLMFRESEYEGIPFLDTTKIHVKKIVEEILS